MIRTRFGSTVTIVGGDLDSGALDIRYEDGSERDVHVSDLKADGGYLEITAALKDCASKLTGGRLRQNQETAS
jgi:hypothetical protein